MKVAVVILNWNGKALLEKFLPSVVKNSSEEAALYLIDNASTDDSVSFVSENFSEVNIIQNKENYGYAGGYNKGLSRLTEDIFILLNSDVEVTANWLTPLLLEFQEDDTLYAAQPKVLDYKNKNYFEYAGAAGGYLDKYGYPFCRGRIFDTLEKDDGQYNDTTPIFWATGACLFIKAEAYKKVGGLDEDFFNHQEEIDLCWRLQNAGGIIKYIGNSTVYHVGGATLSASNPKKTFYNFRNSLLMLVKNRKGWGVWTLLLVRMVLDGIAALRFLLEGKGSHFIVIFKSHLSFYALLPKFLKKRKTNAGNIKYYKIKSIVWNYFIEKKRTFNTNY